MTFRQRKALCWIVTGLFALGSFCLTLSPPPADVRWRFALAQAVYFAITGMTWSFLATYPALNDRPANGTGTK